jgi:hypothetical protein
MRHSPHSFLAAVVIAAASPLLLGPVALRSFAQGTAVTYVYNGGTSTTSGSNEFNPNGPVTVTGDEPISTPSTGSALAGTIQSDPLIINQFTIQNTDPIFSYDSILFTLTPPPSGLGAAIRFVRLPNGSPGYGLGDLDQVVILDPTNFEFSSSTGKQLDPGEFAFIEFYIDAPSPGPTGSSYNFGVNLTPRLSAVIPEPSTGLLALAGALLPASSLVRRGRRRRC